MSNNCKMLIQTVYVKTTGTVMTVVAWDLNPRIVCILTLSCRRNMQPPSSGFVTWFLNFSVPNYLRDPTVDLYRHITTYTFEPCNDC
jgi:hypothetical protein